MIMFDSLLVNSAVDTCGLDTLMPYQFLHLLYRHISDDDIYTYLYNYRHRRPVSNSYLNHHNWALPVKDL